MGWKEKSSSVKIIKEEKEAAHKLLHLNMVEVLFWLGHVQLPVGLAEHLLMNSLLMEATDWILRDVGGFCVHIEPNLSKLVQSFSGWRGGTFSTGRVNHLISIWLNSFPLKTRLKAERNHNKQEPGSEAWDDIVMSMAQRLEGKKSGHHVLKGLHLPHSSPYIDVKPLKWKIKDSALTVWTVSICWSTILAEKLYLSAPADTVSESIPKTKQIYLVSYCFILDLNTDKWQVSEC